MSYFYRLALLACAVFFTNYEDIAFAKSSPCKTGTIEQRGQSVEELVNQSKHVGYVTISGFRSDDSHAPYKGYYELIVLSELSGYFPPKIKIWGNEPYLEVPQSYLDITAVHNRVNPDAVYGGVTGIIELGDNCILNPRFKIGWNYLVLIGLDSEMAFEPVHSPRLDEWFKLVSDAAFVRPSNPD